MLPLVYSDQYYNSVDFELLLQVSKDELKPTMLQQGKNDALAHSSNSIVIQTHLQCSPHPPNCSVSHSFENDSLVQQFEPSAAVH